MSLFVGLAIKWRSLRALVVRDMMMRYGREHLGFIWVVLEPMILTAGVLVIWSIIKPGYEHGIRIVELVLTGYMPLTLWRHMTNNTTFLFRRSAAMLYHRHITVFDILFARQGLEFIGTTTALSFVYLVLSTAGVIDPVQDFGLLLLGWLIMGWLAFGAGAVIVVMTEYNEVTERFIQPFQYLLIPLSGTFFLVNWLPPRAQDAILFNPTVHCFEMFRAGFFGEAVTTYYSIPYVCSWAFALTSLGLYGVNRIRNSIQFT